MVTVSAMASELNSLTGANGTHEDTVSASPERGATLKDEQPLLKSDPASASPTAESIEELEQKYAAYVRRDAYGTMGRGEIPATEKVMLGIAAVTLVPIRLVFGMLILVVYYLICRICTLFSAPHEEDGQEDYAHMGGWRREVVVRCGRFCSRAMLFTFGFYWIKETHRSIGNECLNLHEIILLVKQYQPNPGHICHGVVTERIQEAHENKLCPMMLLFPEGTTTNGDYLLPFKSGAFLAKVPVLPVILRYPYCRFSPAWDSISGVRHVFLLLCQFVNHIEVIWLPVYYPSEQEKEDPKLYANNVRKLMATEGNLTLSDIGLAEKRIYHAVLNGNSLPRVLHQKDD
ncbi:Acyltransferase [Musa troglodytarum]|uniref:Acyltransferase n=1 Tax=Musa troglodytarum TaxID=320322 RepID=A0A9E7KY61_9LILI|nr:Acyltransferase [Musa troglodytarum]